MQFKKPCKMERRSARNSWCVIERKEVTQLETALNNGTDVFRITDLASVDSFCGSSAGLNDGMCYDVTLRQLTLSPTTKGHTCCTIPCTSPSTTPLHSAMLS